MDHSLEKFVQKALDRGLDLTTFKLTLKANGENPYEILSAAPRKIQIRRGDTRHAVDTHLWAVIGVFRKTSRKERGVYLYID